METETAQGGGHMLFNVSHIFTFTFIYLTLHTIHIILKTVLCLTQTARCNVSCQQSSGNKLLREVLQRKWVSASHAEEGFPVKVSFVIRKWCCDAKAVYPHRHNTQVATMKSKPIYMYIYIN